MFIRALKVMMVLFFVFLAGCAARRGTETLGSGEGVSLLLKPEMQETFTFGKPTEASFVLKNLLDKAVVVMSIEPVTSEGENPIALSGSVYGSVSRSKDEDAYHHSSMDQRATRMHFYGGFLLPGQEASVTFAYRPLSSTERFVIVYALPTNAYDGSAESLTPFKVYLLDESSGFDSIYRPFSEKKWLDICKASIATGEIGPGVSPRTVIIPQLTGPIAVEKVEVSIDIKSDEKKAFFIDSAKKAAAKISGVSPENISLGYSSALDGYVVSENDLSWVLKNDRQKARGNLFPRFALTMLKDIDSSGKVGIRIGDKQEGFGPEKHDAGWKFWDKYPVYYGDGMYTRGEFIRIDKDNLTAFLEQVYEEKGTIAEYSYYFRSRYFILELPEKNEK